MARKLTLTTVVDGSIPATKLTNITTDNLSADATDVVRITSISVTNSSYVTIGGTLSISTGGYIKIDGAGFATGCSVVVGNTIATSVTFVSSILVQARLPAKPVGSYFLYVTNPNSSVGLRVNGVTFS